ncbi:uncharacterized protein LOC110844890 [Folsomia candida]|uniref:Gastric intrinsic factor n=1 Tax=Folsomia candida TaxID=158441 RepID=A0A226ERE3_FOLCA|nr:uncharacterized protein LOC110844890 [Folsomia candida]OXA60079.1 Gastric intrinsic factor [Folsomia candida]
MDHKMSNIHETNALLAKQRRRYLIAIAIVSLLGVGLLASTIVFGIKLKGAYPSIRVKYHVGQLTDSKHDIKLKVPENVTMFAVLEHAERESHDRFWFNYTTLSFGRYVTSIGGVSEDEATSQYWILYKVKDEPRSIPPPDTAVDRGIDEIRVGDDDIFVFWLTQFEGYGQKRLEALGGEIKRTVGVCN